MKNKDFKTKCRVCLDEITVSLDDEEFSCLSCGAVNIIEGDKFKAQRKAILNKTLGHKPNKPENN